MKQWWEPGAGTFTRDMASFLFSPGRVAAAAVEAAGLKALLKLGRGQAVLDAACGTGRHSLALARLGLAVTGVDATPAYVREAARRARAAGLDVRFHGAELRRLGRWHGRFDAVLNLFNSFGYYRDDADNAAALGELAACLRPGGRLALELTPRESLEPRFLERDWSAAGDAYLMERRAWEAGRRRIRTDYVLCAGGRVSRGSFSLRIYTVARIRALAARAGLRRLRTWGDFKGRPWRPGSGLILIGER